MGNALDCIGHGGKESIQTKPSRYPHTTTPLSLPSSSAAAASSGSPFFSGRPSLFSSSSSSSSSRKKMKNKSGLSGKGAIDDDHESSSIIQEQAMAAALLFRHHQKNGSLPDFIRSNSVVYPSPGNSKKQGVFPKSSSTRQRSLSDPMITPQQLVNSQQELKIDDLETNHFVLVHGGGFGAWCWYKTMTLLEETGFKVDAVDLTGSGVSSFDTNSITSLAHYVKPLTDIFDKLEDGKKVILVGHDFGGASISFVMELYPSKIAKAVFIAAAMLTSGQSTLDMFSQQMGSNDLMRQAQIFLYANGNNNPPTAVDLDKTLLRDLFFNQSSAKDVALASVSMRPIPLQPVLEKLSLSDMNYGSIRRFYIKTQEDCAITVPLQEAMIESYPPEQVFQLKGSDHAPFFSRPQGGRAGREGPGKCFRLYPEREFEKLEDSTKPEIKRCNLSNVILQLKALGVDDIFGFDFIEKPSRAAIKKSVEELILLGALTDECKMSDPVGYQMARLPLDPVYSKALILASQFNCLEEMLIAVAMLSVESIFYEPREKFDEARTAKKCFASSEGDHLTLVNVYRTSDELLQKRKSEFGKEKPEKVLRKWCKENFINSRSLRHARDIHSQIRRHVEQMGLCISSCGDDTLQFRRCLAAAFFLNAALKQPDGTYRALASGEVVQIHPTSVLFRTKADCIIFNEFIKTTNKYIRNITVIDGFWLTELAPHYYAKQE